MQSIPKLKALVFDVFGTVVDWRSSIVKDLANWGEANGIVCDWAGFAEAWRATYQPGMQRVREGSLPWTDIDSLHLMALRDLVRQFELGELKDEQLDHISKVWHRLEPWPDSVPGLRRLKRRFTIATLSNGNVALLVNMAKHAGLPWDMVFSAELCRHYKPDPEAYLMTFELLDVAPDQVMMVAAHNGDLKAAATQGLRTAFVRRPTEYGPNQTRDLEAEGSYDFVVESIEHLADALGVD